MLKKFTDFKAFNDDPDDVEEDADGKKFVVKTNAILYLVDAGKKMFSVSNDADDENDFVQSLMCIRTAIRNKIHTSEKCMCGILLLGTDKTDNGLNLQHISVLVPLSKLGADHVKEIDEIIKHVKDSTYEAKYGFGRYNLAEAFWVAAKMFTDQTANINKLILLFTNEDYPVQDQNEHNRVISSATDMAQNFIILDLIHLGKNFDVNKFYKEIVQLARRDLNYKLPDPATKMEEMVKRANKIDYRHVVMTKVPFYISDDFVCGVSVGQVTRKLKVPLKVKLSAVTNEKVVSKMQLFESKTGEVVDDDRLIKSQHVGERDVEFKKAELEEMVQIGERGLRLMGFKPFSVINFEHYVKPFSFIYPDESQYKGSPSFFTALLNRCLAKEKVAICTYYPRSTSSVRFVALIPQKEVLANDNTQISPPGFLVFSLPFAEEVRDTEEKVTGRKRAAPEQVDIARKLTKKLKFSYKPECFSHPKLRAHWAAIEAVALDLNEREEVLDSTIPNYEMINNRSHDIAQRFINEIYQPDYDPWKNDKAKRVYPPKDKAAKDKPVFDATVVENYVREGNVQKLSNDVLKNYLQSVGEGRGLSKMKKADLIEKVCQHLKVPVP